MKPEVKEALKDSLATAEMAATSLFWLLSDALDSNEWSGDALEEEQLYKELTYHLEKIRQLLGIE